MDAISLLFNRAVLDTIVGFVTLVLLSFCAEMFFGKNYNSLIFNPSNTLVLIAIIAGSFLLGHLIDKIAYLLLDHFVFAKHFQTRHSTFALPPWCETMMEDEIKVTLAISPDKSHDLIDEAKADWITALFLTRARSELILKREDLVANYEFISSLLFVLLCGLFIVPSYVYYKAGDILYTVGAGLLMLVLCAAYWRFSIALLTRINTFENLVVYGLLMEEKRKKTEQSNRREGENIEQERPVRKSAFMTLLSVLVRRKS